MSVNEDGKCPICKENSLLPPERNEELRAFVKEGDIDRFACLRCGVFDATGSFLSMREEIKRALGSANGRKRRNLSAWLRDRTDQRQRRGGPIPIFDSYFLQDGARSDLRDAFEAAGTPRFHEKADRLLLAIETKTDYAGEQLGFEINPFESLEWEARAWALNCDELLEICSYLKEQKRIVGQVSFTSMDLKLLPDGWKRIEELASTKQASTQGFVAMWFDKKMKPFYEKAFKPAICAAGYLPRRIDHDPPTERLADEIEAEIKRSKFVLADLTGHRNGVYFEAGFARGFGVPVIWTCRSDDFDDLHFDVEQFHCIKWKEDELDKLIDKLRWRIENICGHGPEKCKEAN